MKLTQNEIEAAEVLNSSKYSVSNVGDMCGDKQKNKH
jgi:hypothetical protein